MAERESTAGAAAEEAMTSTRDMVKTGGSKAVEEAKAAVRNMANAQKAKVADRLEGVAHALDETAKNLERQNAGPAGRYAGAAATQVARVSRALKDRGVDDLVGDVEDFARSQPLIFVGAAFATGFILGRFVKSGETGSIRRTSSDLAEEARDVASEAAGRVAEAAGEAAAAGETAGAAAIERESAAAAGSFTRQSQQPGGL